jgi:hypothetical protein
MPIVKNLLLILILISSSLTGEAQLAKNPFIVELKIHSGMNVPFYKALGYLIKDDIYSFDISLSRPADGKDYWEKLYRYPRQGVGFSCWSLGNNEIFGNAYVLYSLINIPLFKYSQKFSLNYQLASGGAFIPKSFNIYTNHLNRAIGSHANLYIHLGVSGRIALSPRSEVTIEAAITHFSNGKTKSPNYGINVVTFSLGFNYLLNKNNFIMHDAEIPAFQKHYIQSVIFSSGLKVSDNLIDRKFLSSSLSYNIEREVSIKRKIGLGADFSYDGSIREGLANKDGVPEKDLGKLLRVGLHSSYAIRYKQMAMGIQVGYYLYSKYTVLTRVYNKISVQYMLPGNFSVNIGVKSHMAKADCLEYGIGYYW